jgi:phage terminase Nu1 subunit (DNA packaging protein)
MAYTATAMTPPQLPGGLIPLLKPIELARAYSVSLWQVNQWVKKGCPVERRLPNGDRRFLKPAVDAWLDAQSEGVEDELIAKAGRLVAARAS